ncbi:hypothetical protein G6F46_000746 [Rhizopus delemar]|uniref:USE1-like protein n=2 Tax=Rhizopus TaxID=4842 RepID=A0A9P7CLQ5_9FUNG|nr:hypothetical protein G6F43_012847 [Rhizopus delemar]KAG1539579.1 hypothetical protein G6F51_009054 [Rhizopus arrhizus]KAG1454106.1 hypothetical protein G6F55_007783 [Rhizopus delemar]KAG1501592.1 hypothetical protein G6F54_002932 [Rhizopus delemar]KAG1518723.1 hypothetical protein G6F53_000366 [Rhizopus delemar]
MPSTTDEINLSRLLLNCERKLQSQPVDLWSASEKRKFATYIKYLSTLQNKTSSEEYINRIKECTKAVSLYRMQVEVDKGIAEARLVKKKHVEELRLLEQPDPDWLREQDEQEKKKESVEEEDRPREEKREESKEEKKEESTSEIRQRTKKGEERFNVEHVLQHHRQMHDELTSDLSRMAQQLKKNSQAFGDTLK